MAYELATAYVQIMPTTKGIGSALESELGGAGSSAGDKAGSGFSGSFGKALKTVGKVAGAALVGAGTAITAFTKNSVQAGMEFDSAMSQVQATMLKTAEEMESEIGTASLKVGDEVKEFSGNLREFAQFMGANTAFSATEAAEALNYMALAGYETQESMDMLPNVLNLASAGAMDLAKASDMVTDTQTAFGLEIDQMPQLIDEMAKAASTGNTNVEQLGEAFLTVGGLAQELNEGMVTLADGTQAPTSGIQEMEIALTAMANAGIKGSEAGTHMRNMLLKLASPTSDGVMQLENLGVAVFDAEGNMRSLKDIMGDMSVALGELTQEQKIQAISDLFNTRDLASAEALLNAVGEDWDKIGASILDAEGAAAEMANIQLANLDGDITLLKSAFEGLQIAVSDGATPYIREAVQGITGIVDGVHELVSGVDGAEEKISAGFSQIVQGISDGLPVVLDIFSSIMDGLVDVFPELLSTVTQQLPKLFDNVLDMIRDLIPNLTGILPDLIDTGVSLVTSLVGHLDEIVVPIIKSIPSVVKSFGRSLVSNLPALLDGVIDLVVGVAESLPDICSELMDYIPELVGGIADALWKAAPKLLEATVGIVEKIGASLLGVETNKEHFERIIGEMADSVGAYRSRIDEAFSQEIDITGLFSSQGNTSAELESAISDIEGKITQIIKENFNEQEGDRQQNLANIREYQAQLRELENEKLGIYENQMGAQITIMENMTGASEEEYMERLGTVKAYHDEAVSVADQAYETDVLNANNYLQSVGGIEDEHYASLISRAEYEHASRIAELDSFYNEAQNIVVNANDAQYSSTVETFQGMSTRMQEWVNSAGSQFTEFMSWLPGVKNIAASTFASYTETLNEADIAAANSMLNMAASMSAGGREVESTVAGNVDTILGFYESLPASMQEGGAESLRGLIQGMEQYFPELGNTAEMTADELVDTVRSCLGISSPSRVFAEIGEYNIQGLTEGMNSQQSTAVVQAAAVMAAVVTAASDYSYVSQMYSIGAYLGEGIAEGLESRSGYIANIAANAVSNAVSAAQAAGDIQSPSRVMREEVGQMLSAGLALGIEDGEDDIIRSVEAVNDDMMDAYSISADIAPQYIHGNQAAAEEIGAAGVAYWNRMADMISAERAASVQNSGRDIVINIYGAEGQSPREMAQAVTQEMNRALRREAAAYA